MDRIPFTVYDFFGYLAAGFVLLVAVDYAFELGWLLGDEFGLVVGIFWIVVAYITGHIVANVAGHVLEGWLVRKKLRSPEETLFADEKPKWRSRLFPGHHKALPLETRERVLAKARTRAKLSEPTRALFIHCHPIVLREEVARAHLESFLNLYGFCRNVCLALLLAAVVLLVGILTDPVRSGSSGEHAGWAIGAALAGAVGMFYRYLKFFREYTIEVFRTYAEVD